MSGRWYRAAVFPSLEDAGQVYALVERLLTGPQRAADVSGYRFVAEQRPWVIVLTDDEPGRLTVGQVGLIEGILCQHGGILGEVDAGILDLLFADWQTKRGSGPPIIERGRNQVAVYEMRGPEASS